MKTKKMFELREGTRYCDTFKTEKAAVKWIENYLKRNYKMWGYKSLASCKKDCINNFRLYPYLQVVA